MKLLNYTTTYFAAILLIIITVWAGLLYFNLLDEIYDSMDDGLENQKLLIIQKATQDSTILGHQNFEEGSYAIKKIPFNQAQTRTDLYLDTLMYMQNEKDFEPIRMLKTAFALNGNFYELRVITSMVEEDDLTEDLFYSLLWLYLGLIASILILNNFLLKRIWRPFYRLLQRLSQFRLEDPKPIELEKTSIEEFQRLNQVVDKMLQNTITTFISQKNFIENAAHELQTPLAISLNKLELLAETDNLTEDQYAILAAAMQNMERLTRLNKSLLLLSKIENNQFAQTGTVNINDLVKKLIADFSEQFAFKNINLTLREEETCDQKANPDLLQILVTNLIKNALVHNYDGGTITIQIKKTNLSIENSGKKEALPGNKIFNRFYKEDSSGQSTGLGLAIVKAICDLYQFRLKYHFQQNHIITLYFQYPSFN